MDESQKYKKILRVRFDLLLSARELPLFRGAVLSLLGDSASSLLYHNHIGDGYRYSYPLIQYKRIGGKAVLVCIGDGVDSVGAFFSSFSSEMRIGNRLVQVGIEQVQAHRCLVQVWQEQFCYMVRKWLPLSSDNYREYRLLEGMVERTQFLQKIMVGNVLSMCKGLGIELNGEVVCEILEISDSRMYMYKGVKMCGFDVRFRTNVSLPDYVGIGKGVSLGFGVVKRMNK